MEDPNALIDASTRDDAAVYRIAEDRALVVTLDFFTPIVDDPFDFGRIAAANALSDVYAMGARPLFALNLLGFPRKLLGEGLVEEIVRGGSEKAREAGIAVLGGHSIDDPEPKYGMVVVGEGHPDRLLSNEGAQVGDALVLTKPLGTGIVATAVKAGACPHEVLVTAVETMAQLNRLAAEAALELGATAATDVTGYGLTGHLSSLLRASGAAAEVNASDVPVLAGVRQLVEDGHVPGGTRRNFQDTAESTDYEDGVDEVSRLLLSDAQTSGGLLLTVPADRTELLSGALQARAIEGAVIGRVVEGTPGTIRILA